MNCNELRQIMEKSLDQGLDSATRKAVGWHLAECSECMELINQDKFWDESLVKLFNHEAPADLRNEILGDLANDESGSGASGADFDNLDWRKKLKLFRWASQRNKATARDWALAVAMGALIYWGVPFLQKQSFSNSGCSFQSSDPVSMVNNSQRTTPANIILARDQLNYSIMFEKVLNNGDVEIWNNWEFENTQINMIESIVFEAAEWELEEVRNQIVIDSFGNRLETIITRLNSHSYRVEIPLLVPFAPKESMKLMVKRIRKNFCQKLDDGQWSFTQNTHFSNDRFLIRKVEFPKGAVVTVPEGWRKNEFKGRTILHSHFKCATDTEGLQVIEYRLP
ncbi:MAG: hypothetical protein GY780_07360 [bacterium]|nr:hypothetical protein [bacterium]